MDRISELKKTIRAEIKICPPKMVDKYLNWMSELDRNPDDYDKISRLVYGSKFCWNCKHYAKMWTRTQDGEEVAQFGNCRLTSRLYHDMLVPCNGYCDDFERLE